MENPSDTTGSSPSFEGSPPSSLSSEQGLKEPIHEVREWSQRELDTVCALICKHKHRPVFKGRSRRKDGKDSDEDRALGFATKLNKALHGAGNYQDDIPVADVRELMDFIETKNRNLMAYVNRQSTPFRITRSKKYAFQRLYTDFNRSFSKWTALRRERRQNTNIDTENDMIQGANLQNIRDSVSNSVYAEQYRGNPNSNNTSGSDSIPNTYSFHLPISRTKLAHGAHRHPNQRGVFPPLPLPLPPSLPQYEQTNVQQSEPYGMEGMGAGANKQPTGPAYYGNSNQVVSSSPFPPTSPAYLGHPDLRQSIHPTGPRPETPTAMASPAYQYQSKLHYNISSSMGQQLDTRGYTTSPAHNSLSTTFMGYQCPRRGRENGNLSYGTVLDTPASPSSPTHVPDAVPSMVMGPQKGEEPKFNLALFDYGEYALDY